MPRQINMESAQRIAAVWDSSRTLVDNMMAAGFHGAERNMRLYRKQAEANPANHRQGFVVLTVDGQDIHPELVSVKNGKARFRGRVYKA